jgi:hypothetical protein
MHRTLLVPNQIMSKAVAHSPEFIVDVKNGSSGIPKDGIDSFIEECLNQHFGARREGSRTHRVADLWI